MHFEIGQRYTTSEGNEYIVDYIARESGNINDLFVVYKKASAGEGNDEERYYLKKTTDFRSVDDFDEKNPSPSSNDSESSEEGFEDVSIGQKYQHFKTKDFYIVKAIACDPKDSEKKFIIYEGQYDSPEFGPHPIWVREYGEFTGMKTFGETELDENGKQKAPVERFKLIN